MKWNVKKETQGDSWSFLALTTLWWKWVISLSGITLNPFPYPWEGDTGVVCFCGFRRSLRSLWSQLIRNRSAGNTQLCNMKNVLAFVCIWWFFPYFFRKTNAEQRLGRNLGINVNIHSVETQPNTGPFSATNVFVSNLQSTEEALSQLFGGGWDPDFTLIPVGPEANLMEYLRAGC